MSGTEHRRRRRGGGGLPSLGPGVLTRAQADLAAPTVQYGARVTAMLATVGASPPGPWNFAAAWTWIQESAHAAGYPVPLRGTPTDGPSLVVAFQRARRWIPRASLAPAAVRPGMLAFRRLAPASPVVLVGVVQGLDAQGRILAILGQGGEAHDRVATQSVALTDALLLGVGSL